MDKEIYNDYLKILFSLKDSFEKSDSFKINDSCFSHNLCHLVNAPFLPNLEELVGSDQATFITKISAYLFFEKQKTSVDSEMLPDLQTRFLVWYHLKYLEHTNDLFTKLGHYPHKIFN